MVFALDSAPRVAHHYLQDSTIVCNVPPTCNVLISSHFVMYHLTHNNLMSSCCVLSPYAVAMLMLTFLYHSMQ